MGSGPSFGSLEELCYTRICTGLAGTEGIFRDPWVGPVADRTDDEVNHARSIIAIAKVIETMAVEY